MKYSDELYHAKSHKYLYKKKVNGKWRYYYYVGKNAYGSDRDSVRGYTKLQDMLGYDERDKMARATARYDNEVRYDVNKAVPTADKEKLTERNEKRKKIYGRRAIYAVDAYFKTPLGKIDNAGRAIDRGRNAVANILERTSKKIRPKQRYYHD